MADTELRPQSAASGPKAAPDTIPWDLSNKIGLPTLKNSFERLIPNGELSTVSEQDRTYLKTLCSQIGHLTRKEISLRPTTDPLLPTLRGILKLTEMIWEPLSGASYFEKKLFELRRGIPETDPRFQSEIDLHQSVLRTNPKFILRDGTSLLLPDTTFTELALESSKRELKVALNALKALSLPPKPIKERLVGGVMDSLKVGITALALLSLKGASNNQLELLSMPPAAAGTDDELLHAQATIRAQQQAEKKSARRASSSGIPPGLVSQPGQQADRGPKVSSGTSAGKNTSPSGDTQTLSPNLYPAWPPQGHRITIEFPVLSAISETLWSGSIYARDQNGEFTQIERRTTLKDSDIEAEVTIEAFHFENGERHQALTPFGFGVLDIKEVTSDGVPLPFSFDAQGQTITLLAGDGSKDATIKYRVTDASELLELPAPVYNEIRNSDFNHRIISALRTDPSRAAEALDLISGQYTYVTGSSLSYALLPLHNLDPVEVYSNLGIADCDVLSMILATRLNQAGIPAGVITGQIERKGALAGGHAKVIYQDHEGSYRTYESTSRMKEVITNLSLTNEEERLIKQIANEIALSEDYQARAPRYRELRALLAKITASPENQKKIDKADEVSSSSRGLTDNLEGIYSNLSYDQRELLQALFIVGATVVVAGAVVAGTRRSYRGIVTRTINLATETIENPIKSLGTVAIRGNLSKEVESLIESQRDFIKSSLHELQRIAPRISERLKGAETLEYSQLVPVIKYLALIEALGPHHRAAPILSLPQVLYAFRVHKILKENSALVGIDQAFKAGLNTSLSQKRLEHERAKIADRVNDIIEAAKRLAIERESRSKAAQKGSLRPLGRARILSSNRSDDFHGFREVQLGEGVDARVVDWKASARSDKILVRQTETPRAERPDNRKPIHVVVDLSGTHDHSFRDLAGILMLKGGDRRILSLTFCAHGEVLKSFNEKALRNELQGINNIERLKKLICWSLEKQLESGLNESWKVARARLANGSLLEASHLLFPSGLIHRTEETAVFGNHYFQDGREKLRSQFWRS